MSDHSNKSPFGSTFSSVVRFGGLFSVSFQSLRLGLTTLRHRKSWTPTNNLKNATSWWHRKEHLCCLTSLTVLVNAENNWQTWSHCGHVAIQLTNIFSESWITCVNEMTVTLLLSFAVKITWNLEGWFLTMIDKEANLKYWRKQSSELYLAKPVLALVSWICENYNVQY